MEQGQHLDGALCGGGFADAEAQADVAISGACAELPVEIDRSGEVIMDGHRLMPMVKYYNLPKEITDGIRQKIVFE